MPCESQIAVAQFKPDDISDAIAVIRRHLAKFRPQPFPQSVGTAAIISGRVYEFIYEGMRRRLLAPRPRDPHCLRTCHGNIENLIAHTNDWSLT